MLVNAGRPAVVNRLPDPVNIRMADDPPGGARGMLRRGRRQATNDGRARYERTSITTRPTELNRLCVMITGSSLPLNRT